jgi:type IV pilus assembly protein PilY1
MKEFRGNSLLLSILGIVVLAARSAGAQSDINFAAPNVLLLVDSSGSMEYLTTSATQTSQVALPSCDPTAATSAVGKDKSRWVNVVEVLGGTIPNYHCQSISRTSVASGNAFDAEYKLSSTQRPPDFGFILPYHRPLSGNCARGPGSYDVSHPFAPPTTASFRDHAYTSTSTACSFTQNTDGIISAFAGKVRFGLMTFDTSTGSGTGYAGSGAFVGSAADLTTGVNGSWSYYYNTCASGKPVGCVTPATPFEVGARNPAAPPWEGRMVAFGAPDSLSAALTDRAEWIRNILLTTRPYGGTPIAGMLADAYTFLFDDTRKDPVYGVTSSSSADDFGPYRDPYVLGGCRKNVIVLLTDGEPNLELRPDCEDGTTDANCPYKKTHEIATDLYVNKNVQTFVVGFAVSQVKLSDGTTVDCRAITKSNISSICSNPDPKLQVCCTLDRIALSGSGDTERAYFADSPGELRSALSAIFSKVSTGTTSRTWPVVASAYANTASSNGVAGYRFYTSFVPKADLGRYGSLWSGVIERQRYVCVTPSGGGVPQPTLQKTTLTDGDSFADNVNADTAAGSHRHFFTVIGNDAGSGAINSIGFIRPNLAADDGGGTYGGTQTSTTASTRDSFASVVPAAAMSIGNSTCSSDNPPLSTASDCALRRMSWLVGGIDTKTGYNRCAAAGSTNCSLIADVLHSTPVVVNRPTDAPRDQTYQAFSDFWKERPLMLYTSTNDGMLHAFKIASNYISPRTDPMPVTSQANNELWAFIPPAVLPKIDSEWPGAHQELLDGAPVVGNVVATPVTANATYSSAKYLFERTTGDFAGATNGTGTATTTWRTVLVQGLNKSQGGYFALDITNPDLSVGSPYLSANGASLNPGPRFLWQLTDPPPVVPAPATPAPRVFGPRSGTPVITTLFFRPTPSSTAAREIAVAILPGGYAEADTGSPAPTTSRQVLSPTTVDSSFPVRGTVPVYSSVEAKAARSLTIVRLDTGEIVRTFRQAKAELPVALQAKWNYAPIDSPITGQPVAYPALAGAIADRVFVGDRDGALWRVNLASTNPNDWTMTMFFDAYSGQAASAGQPIVTQPQLSIDDLGRVTVAFATGNQDTFSAVGTNYVWSLIEDINWSPPVSFRSKAQWYRKYTSGEVPVGPLQLFNSGLYFATYQPPQTTSACSTGTSKVWGMHYLNLDTTAAASDGSNNLSRGGQAWLPKQGDANNTTDKVQYLTADISCTNGTTQSNNTDCTHLVAGATIFGVSIAQVPSCVDSSSSTDAFFAQGLHTTMPNATAARFQLVMQTGRSGSSANGGQTNSATIDLQPQNNNPRIAAWASIME